MVVWGSRHDLTASKPPKNWGVNISKTPSFFFEGDRWFSNPFTCFLSYFCSLPFGSKHLGFVYIRWFLLPDWLYHGIHHHFSPPFGKLLVTLSKHRFFRRKNPLEPSIHPKPSRGRGAIYIELHYIFNSVQWLENEQWKVGPTWRIIPNSKWLVTAIYKPFRPFGKGTMVINHLLTGMILQAGCLVYIGDYITHLANG